MTLQESFDRMVIHLRIQGQPARTETGGCVYRGLFKDEQGAEHKTACAVGCLIPDEEYNPAFEGHSSLEIQEEVPALRGLPKDFLGLAQTAHDDWYPEDSSFEDGPAGYFKNLADKYHLDSSALTRPLTPST